MISDKTFEKHFAPKFKAYFEMAHAHGSKTMMHTCGCAIAFLPRLVEREVKRRLALFPKGGLFLGPAHAIQVGSPLESTLALYPTAGSLMETVDDNTTATVYVPAKHAASVTESGRFIGTVKGVKFLRMANGTAVYELGSGCYQSCSEL